MNAKEIFQMLDKECEPYSTPLPNKITDECRDIEVIGFFGRIMCESFNKMRETNGENEWKVECSFLRKKYMGKCRMTSNAMRKSILKCLEHKYIKDFKEEDNEIWVTINVEYLFNN